MPVTAETLAIILEHAKDTAGVLAIVRALDAQMSPATNATPATVDGDKSERPETYRDRKKRLDRERIAQKRAEAANVASVAGDMATSGDASSPLVPPSLPPETPKTLPPIIPPSSASAENSQVVSLFGDETPSKREKAKRGTRIEPDWMPTVDDFQIGIKEGLTDAEVRREIEKFRDWWTAKPGKDGTKLDWDATFRMWIRKAADDKAARQQRLRN